MLKYCISLIIFFLSHSSIFSQNELSDNLLLIYERHQQSELPKVTKRKKKLLQKINPVYWIYRGGLRLYQTHVSPQLASNCIYETSCSRFSNELINHFGIVKGVFLSCDRITRCNRVTFVESSPLRRNSQGKIVEKVEDFAF